MATTMDEFFQVMEPGLKELYMLKMLRWTQTGDLSSFMTPKQKEIHDLVINGSEFEYYVLCSRRFGKTYLDVCIAIGLCLRNPGAVVYIVGPEIKQTLKMIRRQLAALIKNHRMPKGLFKDLPADLGPGWIFPNGSEVYIAGFSNKSNPNNVRGDFADMILVEEARDFHPDYYNDAIQGVYKPMLTDRDGKIIFFTTPPNDPNHPFVKDVEASREKNNNTFFMYTLDDNDRYSQKKRAHIIESFGGRQSVYVRREFFCEIVRDSERMVVPCFDRTKHIRDIKLKSGAFYLVGGDIGGKRDKTAVFVMAVDSSSGSCVFVDERVFNAGTPSSKIIDGIRSMENMWSITSHERYLDMGEQNRLDHETDHNFLSHAPEKTDLDAAIKAFNDGFDDGMIFISSRCPFLAESVESVKFKTSKKDIERTEKYGHGDAVIGAVYCYRMRHRARGTDNQSFTVTKDYETQGDWTTGYLGIAWGRLNRPTVMVGLTDKMEIFHYSSFQMNPCDATTDHLLKIHIKNRNKRLTVCHDSSFLSRGHRQNIMEQLRGFNPVFSSMDTPSEKNSRLVDSLFDDLEEGYISLAENHALHRESLKILHDPDAYTISQDAEALIQAHRAICHGRELLTLANIYATTKERSIVNEY